MGEVADLLEVLLLRVIRRDAFRAIIEENEVCRVSLSRGESQIHQESLISSSRRSSTLNWENK